jgi:hypothetical protein
MFGPSATFPTGPGGGFGAGSGSSGFSGRDIIWVDLRFPGGIGNNGTEDLPHNTANLGLGMVPDGGTLIMVGGDATTEPGFTIGARSGTFRGLGGQMGSGGLTPKLPTLTYAITTGTQRLAFHNVSVALVHSGTSASLTQFHFEFCPSVTLTGGTDAPPVYWVGDGTCLFSGAGGPAQLIGGTIDGYTANSGAIVANGCAITGNLDSPSSVTLLGGCSFTAISVTAPSISVDAASYARALAAGVSFSSAVTLLVAVATPVDIGTANAAGTAKTLALSDHVHDLPFTPVQDALGAATASVSFNNQKITNLATPTSGGDAVNKTYADAIAVGLKLKNPAVAVAVANQATMSGQAQTIDGVALNTVGQRVLLTAQTTATQNGLWVIAAGAWTRPTDFAAGSSAALSYVPVTGGTVYAGSGWLDTNTAGSDVVDTNNLTWGLFTQPSTITAGAGLTKTGNTIDVVANADGSIVVSADDVKVGVLATDAQHGLRGGGTQHANATTSVAGFMSAADKTKIDGITGDGVERVGKAPVRAATTANITLSGTQTIDGVSLITGDRCLVKNQGTGSQNGIYVVASGAWARSTDADGAGDLVGGVLVPISEGTVNGNQVAMLTTDDPITIGTTALTFAMGRVAAIGASAPQDVTQSAAQVGASTLVAPLDHVHRITFTVVAAVLAAASAAISVNSQKIIDLATPTVATDAATKGYVDALVPTPANPADDGKVAYASGGAIVCASSVKTDGSNYVAIGGTPASSGSGLRLANAAKVWAAKTTGGAFALIALLGDDTIYVGDQSVSELNLEVGSNLDFDFSGGSNPEYRFTSSTSNWGTNTFQIGGGTYPSSGLLRTSNNPGVLWGYRSYNATSRQVLALTGNGTSFDDIAIGDANATDGNATLYLNAKAQAVVQLAAGNEYVFSASALDVTNNNIVQGNIANASAQVFWIRGAGSTSGSNTGGRLRLTGGSSTVSGSYGPVDLALNPDDGTPQPMVEVAHLAAARRVVSLCKTTAITTSEIPTNGGDGVVWLAAAATSPTVGAGAIGSGGAVFWAENGGKLRTVGLGGCYYDLSGSTAAGGGTLHAVIKRNSTLQTTDVNRHVIDSYSLPSGCVANISANILGRQSTTNRAGYFVRATVRQDAGTAFMVGVEDVLAKESNSAWDVFVSVSGSSVQIEVQGVAATTIDWWVEWTISIHQP